MREPLHQRVDIALAPVEPLDLVGDPVVRQSFVGLLAQIAIDLTQQARMCVR